MRPSKTLGVLGGMGPAATADFLKVLAENAPAHTDQEHPRMIVYSNTITPDRTTFLLGKGPDPTDDIRDGLNTLIGWGADMLCATCNTAHYFIDLYRAEKELPVKFVHIIEETIKRSKELSPEGAWLTATLGTMCTGLYQKYAAKYDYQFRIPSEQDQIAIHYVTDMVKGGENLQAGEKFGNIVRHLWKVEELPVVGACTEIPIAYQNSGLPKDKGISCLEALAQGCIRELYKQ